ncbi:hypothetical protein G6F56_007319 [Rhizopus delemar]|nr:hypothetical protein G6F56_007319 [Rhizopus delemar]
MSMQFFFYEDGQGRVVNENGVDPIDVAVDEELFAIETISSRTQFLMNKPSERSNPVMHLVMDKNSEGIYMELCNKRRYTAYSDEDKTRFLHLFFSRSFQVFAAARQLGIHIRAAQRWIKPYYEDPERIFVKKNKSGQRRILREESELSANGLINVSLRVSKRIKKRKLGRTAGGYSKGAMTGHYLSFLKATLDEMGKYPEMKGRYLVMDNAPTHNLIDIGKYIHSRGYRHAYLPPYSPELNLIE